MWRLRTAARLYTQTAYLLGQLYVDGEDRSMGRSSLRHDAVLKTRSQLVQQLQSVLAPRRRHAAPPATSDPVVIGSSQGALVT